MIKIAALIIGAVVIAIVMLVLRQKRFESQINAAMSDAWTPPKPDPTILEIRGFEFYVRLNPTNSDNTLKSLLEAVGDRGTIYARPQWAVVLWGELNPPESLLQEISANLDTQLIWLAFQKQVDAFEFLHWDKGQLRRRLTYGCYEQERTWEKVEGEAEAWEASALFNPRDLERELRSLKEYPPEGKSVADAEAELRAIWKDRRLAVNSAIPAIIGRDGAEKVAVAYSLPGWR